MPLRSLQARSRCSHCMPMLPVSKGQVLGLFSEVSSLRVRFTKFPNQIFIPLPSVTRTWRTERETTQDSSLRKRNIRQPQPHVFAAVPGDTVFFILTLLLAQITPKCLNPSVLACSTRLGHHYARNEGRGSRQIGGCGDGRISIERACRKIEDTCRRCLPTTRL